MRVATAVQIPERTIEAVGQYAAQHDRTAGVDVAGTREASAGVAGAGALDRRIAGVVAQRLQPRSLEIETDDNQHVGARQEPNKARPRHGEVRILGAAHQSVDGDEVAPHRARQRAEVGDGDDYAQRLDRRLGRRGRLLRQSARDGAEDDNRAGTPRGQLMLVYVFHRITSGAVGGRRSGFGT